MKKAIVWSFLFTACGSPSALPDYVDLRGKAERLGTALQLSDGRIIAVKVVPIDTGYNGIPCGRWYPPNQIVVYFDPRNCPDVEEVLQHELAHAYGLKDHTPGHPETYSPNAFAGR